MDADKIDGLLAEYVAAASATLKESARVFSGPADHSQAVLRMAQAIATLADAKVKMFPPAVPIVHAIEADLPTLSLNEARTQQGLPEVTRQEADLARQDHVFDVVRSMDGCTKSAVRKAMRGHDPAKVDAALSALVKKGAVRMYTDHGRGTGTQYFIEHGKDLKDGDV